MPHPESLSPVTRAPQRPESPLQTVDRALQVLSSFSEHRQSWSVAELAESFEFTASTAHRLLASLAARGYLANDTEQRRYTLGPAVWRISELYERSGGLARLAESILVPLAAHTRLTAQFAVPDGSHVRCVAAVDGHSGPVPHHPWVGDIYPAFAGATPRAYFAFLPAREQHSLLAALPLVAYTPATPVGIDEIVRSFDETAARGWAESTAEYNPHSEAIAVPIMLGSRPRGSISVVRLGEPDPSAPELQRYVPVLQQAAHEFSARLSSRMAGPPARDRPGGGMPPGRDGSGRGAA